ncbi:Rne/Rng family ribonuclease [Pseudonocardia xinjiangensis]|uniref:Rne/Rng family ribonuclease n=1 Tax=Pseudonocardia xinjiangensis TaxID=75289 RepID=A0ABX1RJ41_9PSEU|nr:translation initiation factor IF-2 N-terminal domain-containing protein [Pseudonocardia xinjiangensis]NMH79115.1 Rne/Rng family ribonuclease [Pseudonocardia xinjiangensis]
MSNIDSPAGSTGGPVTVPGLDELPERMRVHALAKLLGRTSREVMAALTDLGVEVRSAQSSIDRKSAEQVVTALVPGSAEPAAGSAEPLVEEPPAAAEPAGAEVAAPLTPLFAPPTPLFQPPTRPARTRRRSAEAAPAPVDVEPDAPAGPDTDAGTAPDADTDTTDEQASPPAADGDESDDDGARRRRRRGRRGRGRGRGSDGFDDESGDDSDDSDEPARADAAGAEADEAAASDEPSAEQDDDSDRESDDEAGGSRRRRRRRRRRGAGDDSADTPDEPDAPNTVVRVRQPREQRTDDSDGDGVQSVRGSTRLEAKRQRRRDGRDAGRRRVPILSEAEFLARRESVDRAMVVREHSNRVEIAVLEDDILVEHFVTDQGGTGPSMVGNIYLGRVQNVLPSMEAAFVDIGRGRNAVLYAGEVDWDAAGLGGKARRIEQALSSGDSVLVQVTKDPIGHKGARLTTQISLAGRFLVYVPSGGAAGISRKLPDVERKRLKDMLKEIVPSEAGVIIRTASEGVSHEALERDVRRLQAQWEVVKTRAEQTGPNKPKAPVLLYEEPDLLLKVVRDQFNEDFSRLIVEGDDAWDTLQNYVGHVAPELADRLHRHVGPSDVFEEYRIDEQLLKALDRKVWLPSGGTLVIDRTEAMTVIDVNTGKFTGSGGNLEETVTRNNLEAAEEVVRQLRLRDIGGIIVIDFIDMVLEANRDLVLRRLTECLARDRTRHQVAEVTSLGLVQMTRKRVGGGLLEHFSTPCEHCRGRGVLISTEPLTEKADPGRTERGDRSDRGADRDRDVSGRRSRGRNRRGDGDERGGQQNGAHQGGGQHNGVTVDAVSAPDASDAAIDVGAPTPVAEAPAAVAEPAPAEPSVAVEAPVVADVPVAEAADAPVVDAPAVEDPQVVEAPAPTGRRSGSRRVVRRGVVETSPQAGPVDVAADAVEEVVVERSLAEQATRPAPAASEEAADSASATVADPATEANGQPRPRQRRGRVTRTAGAPAAASGDAPVAAVVTVPATPAAASEPATPVAVPPQPEPTGVTRPRRTRRAASRPAGPPATGDGGGDPV